MNKIVKQLKIYSEWSCKKIGDKKLATFSAEN